MTCRRKNSAGETGGNGDEGEKPPPTERAECLVPVGFVDRVHVCSDEYNTRELGNVMEDGALLVPTYCTYLFLAALAVVDMTLFRYRNSCCGSCSRHDPCPLAVFGVSGSIIGCQASQSL
jgi:hypothetical protein